MGLDLSRIDAWTREMLEAEARRRRIRNPEFRTRGDLIRLLLKHQYGDRVSAGRERIAKGMRTARQARELFGLAMDAALSALPEPFGSIMRLRSGQVTPPPRSSPRAPRPAPTGETPRSVATTTEVASEPPPVHVSTTSTDVLAPAAAPIEATTRTFIEEPIRTRTMARLLAAQGHRERALLIYEELLAQNSADSAIQDEADAVRRGEVLAEPHLPEPPFGADRWPLPETDDRLSCEGDPSTGLTLRWSVTEGGQLRAGAVLGERGELALRIISIQPDPERVVRSQITEHGPVGDQGLWQAPALAPGARCFAAVGLRTGNRFVAIVHAHPRVESAATSAPAHAL